MSPQQAPSETTQELIAYYSSIVSAAAAPPAPRVDPAAPPPRGGINSFPRGGRLQGKSLPPSLPPRKHCRGHLLCSRPLCRIQRREERVFPRTGLTKLQRAARSVQRHLALGPAPRPLAKCSGCYRKSAALCTCCTSPPRPAFALILASARPLPLARAHGRISYMCVHLVCSSPRSGSRCRE